VARQRDQLSEDVTHSQVLEWLVEPYDISREVMLVKREAMNLRRARTVGAIRSVEGRVALKY
jgi:hypothetical protein